MAPSIVVDQRSAIGAPALTPTSNNDLPGVYKNSGTGIQIQSERVYKNPQNSHRVSEYVVTALNAIAKLRQVQPKSW